MGQFIKSAKITLVIDVKFSVVCVNLHWLYNPLVWGMDQLCISARVTMVTLPEFSARVLFENNASWEAVVGATLGLEPCVSRIGKESGLFSVEHFRVCPLQPRKVVMVVCVVDWYRFVRLFTVWIA